MRIMPATTQGATQLKKRGIRPIPKAKGVVIQKGDLLKRIEVCLHQAVLKEYKIRRQALLCFSTKLVLAMGEVKLS